MNSFSNTGKRDNFGWKTYFKFVSSIAWALLWLVFEIVLNVFYIDEQIWFSRYSSSFPFALNSEQFWSMEYYEINSFNRTH